MPSGAFSTAKYPSVEPKLGVALESEGVPARPTHVATLEAAFRKKLPAARRRGDDGIGAVMYVRALRRRGVGNFRPL